MSNQARRAGQSHTARCCDRCRLPDVMENHSRRESGLGKPTAQFWRWQGECGSLRPSLLSVSALLCPALKTTLLPSVSAGWRLCAWLCARHRAPRTEMHGCCPELADSFVGLAQWTRATLCRCYLRAYTESREDFGQTECRHQGWFTKKEVKLELSFGQEGPVTQAKSSHGASGRENSKCVIMEDYEHRSFPFISSYVLSLHFCSDKLIPLDE